jgi:hypothetical protein
VLGVYGGNEKWGPEMASVDEQGPGQYPWESL